MVPRGRQHALGRRLPLGSRRPSRCTGRWWIASWREAFERSEVMDTASWLIDVFRAAELEIEWVRRRVGVGQGPPRTVRALQRAARTVSNSAWAGRTSFTSVHMMAPQYMPMIAYPAAWSAGTHGKIRASVVHVDFESIASEAELEQYRGRLDDRILLIAPVQEVSAHFEYLPTRFTDEELDGMAEIPIPLGGSEPAERRGRLRRDGLSREAFYDFVFAEGALAVVRPDGRGNGHGIVDAAVNGYSMTRRMWETTAPPPVVEVIVAAEHYNRIVRILDKGIPVEMEIEIEAEFSGSDTSDTTDTNRHRGAPGQRPGARDRHHRRSLAVGAGRHGSHRRRFWGRLLHGKRCGY